MRHPLPTLALLTLVAGCANLPAPNPALQGAGASPLLPDPSTVVATGVPTPAVVTPGFQPSSLYQFANPRPSVQVVPAAPCAGATVNATVSGLPADQGVEWWVTAQVAGGFKGGLFHPRDAGGMRLGESVADAHGATSLAFTLQAPPGVLRDVHVAPCIGQARMPWEWKPDLVRISGAQLGTPGE